MGLIIETAGNSLVVNVDGQRLICWPAVGGIWKLAIGGDLYIDEIGNSLIINTGASRIIAVPTGSGQWIANASFDPGPGPDPGTGDFSQPYDYAYVTSEYGPRWGRFHEGIDWSGGPAIAGNPIPAIGDGVVEQSYLHSNFGNMVVINHGTLSDGKVYRSLYAHMQSPGLSVGTNVSKADTVGPLGNTGNSFGAHLHLEIHKGPSIIWDTANPSYSSPRTAMNPRHFFTSFGDGNVIYP